MRHNIIAEIHAQTSDLTGTRHALANLEKVTQEEAGCIMFSIKESQNEPGKFFLWEIWEDQSALDRHMAAPHTQEYFARNLTELVTFEVLQPLQESHADKHALPE